MCISWVKIYIDLFSIKKIENRAGPLLVPKGFPGTLRIRLSKHEKYF
jgi:hypothetical protein